MYFKTDKYTGVFAMGLDMSRFAYDASGVWEFFRRCGDGFLAGVGVLSRDDDLSAILALVAAGSLT